MAPTTEQVLQVAQAAIKVFAKHGLDCCLIGSAASYLYGDVDIVVLTTSYDQETLKRMLAGGDPKFYLLSSKKRFATYKIVWYSLSTRSYAYPNSNLDCKVDILVPGILNIPNVPLSLVKTISGLPVMPLIPQLLLKLQGWSDHRDSDRSVVRAKQYVDVRDIDGLLAIAVERGASIEGEDAEWVPESMITAARVRLWWYTLRASRGSAAQWRTIGFSV